MNVRWMLATPALLAAILLGLPSPATAHCDAIDGPVVLDARAALDSGDLTPLLKWIPAEDTAALQAAFDSAREVRRAGGAAATLAETWFFETAVRIHRAGEGAPYTGLKAAGFDPGPAIRAADLAIHDGNPRQVADLLLDEVRQGLKHRFLEVRETADFDDVEGGRRHVHAYVEFVHYVERLHQAATTLAHPTLPGHAEAH